MEKSSNKNKYERQDRYFKKTYDRVSISLRKEWGIYDFLKKEAHKNNSSMASISIYYLVEGLKKDGFKPSPELKAFIDNSYKK